MVELIFLDDNGNEYDVAEDEDDLEEELSIDEGDTETAVFEFSVDGDIEDGDYNLYVKVYEDGNEDDQCVSMGIEENDDIETIEVSKDKYDVVVKEVNGDSTVQAGKTATFDVKVANLGRNDEDQVRVIAYNSILGINQNIVIENFDEGDTETITFLINMPSDGNGTHKVRFSTEFDYDDNDDQYDKESDSNDDILYSVTLIGGTSSVPETTSTEPTVTATLASDAEEGEELVVQATIKNNGEDGSLVITADGYQNWAELVSVDPMIASLDNGESAQVTITLKPTTSGTQTFNIKTISGGEESLQPVSVTVSENEGLLDFFKNLSLVSWLVYGIILLVVVILVIVIVKVSNSPKAIDY